MTKVDVSTRLAVPAQAVWDVVGSFAGLPDWHPAVESSEQHNENGATIRRLSLVGGGSIVEQLESLDDKERAYSYSILSGPLPVADYRATVRVRDDDGGGCTVQWSSEFNPSGAPESDAVAAIRGIYETGFENLKRMFGG